MGDLLSAASLLLAVLAALLALWMPELDRAISAVIPPQKANAQLPLKPLRSALFAKALPLLVAVSACLLVFLPKTLEIVGGAWAHWRDKSYAYDPLQAAFVLTQAFLLAIAIFVVLRGVGIARKIYKRRS
ncbi:MAG: hypothetical protein ACREEB_01405 [Caulobacteraceae bacterium]